MYYVFQVTLQDWRNQIIRAELRDYGIDVGRAKNHQHVPVPEPEPHWWKATPLVAPLPHLTFTANPNAPIPDNFFTGTIFDLYSVKLITLLEEFHVRFEVFPATIVVRKTNALLPVEYNVFHLLEIEPALDVHQSVFQAHNIKKLVITSQCLAAAKPLFRVQEAIDLVLIHQRLKDVLTACGITGCTYTPVDEYTTGVPFDQTMA
jgi:hypothetical protein